MVTEELRFVNATDPGSCYGARFRAYYGPTGNYARGHL